MARVKVKCIEGRRVGDDEYTPGETYEMDDVRAAKYGDYFVVTGKVKAKRSSKKVQAKNAGATEDK
jgi:hypothetical protein